MLESMIKSIEGLKKELLHECDYNGEGLEILAENLRMLEEENNLLINIYYDLCLVQEKIKKGSSGLVFGNEQEEEDIFIYS